MADLKSSLEKARRGIVPPPDAFDRLVQRRARKQRVNRIASIAVAVVVVAVGAVGAFLAFGTGGSGRSVPASGGDASPASRSLVANDGQFYYTRTEIYYGEQPARCTSSCPDVRVAGPWTIRLWFGPGPDVEGRAAFTDYTGPPASASYSWGTKPLDKTYGPNEMPYDDLSSLPSDPDELRAVLTERAGPNGSSPNPIPTTSPGRSPEDSALLRTLQDLFNGDEALTPPDVRAAMFEVARDTTGVQTLRDVQDPVGRDAVALRWAIQYSDDPSFVTWYFEPGTKQLMAETWGTPDNLFEARVVTDAGIADSTKAEPTADERFFPIAQHAPSFLH